MNNHFSAEVWLTEKCLCPTTFLCPIYDWIQLIILNIRWLLKRSKLATKKVLTLLRPTPLLPKGVQLLTSVRFTGCRTDISPATSQPCWISSIWRVTWNPRPWSKEGRPFWLLTHEISSYERRGVFWTGLVFLLKGKLTIKWKLNSDEFSQKCVYFSFRISRAPNLPRTRHWFKESGNILESSPKSYVSHYFANLFIHAFTRHILDNFGFWFKFTRG